MSQAPFTTRHGHLVCFIVLFMTSTLLASCSHRVLFTNSRVVPAAEGSIRLSHDNNQNGAIDVYVKYLAPPARLSPPKQVYVVWVKTVSNGTKNIGQIEVSDGSQGGHLSAITAYKVKGVFITGEDNADVLSPGMEPVLMTKDF